MEREGLKEGKWLELWTEGVNTRGRRGEWAETHHFLSPFQNKIKTQPVLGIFRKNQPVVIKLDISFHVFSPDFPPPALKCLLPEIIPASFCPSPPFCHLLAFLIFSPSCPLHPSACFSSHVSYLTPPFPPRQSPSPPPPPLLSSPLQHLCPCRGGVPAKRKPSGQPGTSQMVSKLHLHYLSSPLPLFLRPALHNDSLFLWHLTSVSGWPAVCS